MENETRASKLVAGFSFSGIVAVTFVTVSTIYGELYAPFKTWLAATFSHHWVGKGIIATLLFIILGLVFTVIMRKKREYVVLALTFLMWSSILGSFALLGFYSYEFFIHH